LSGLTATALWTINDGLRSMSQAGLASILRVDSSVHARVNGVLLSIFLVDLPQKLPGRSQTDLFFSCYPNWQPQFLKCEVGRICCNSSSECHSTIRLPGGFRTAINITGPRGFCNDSYIGFRNDSFCGVYYNNSNFMLAHQIVVTRLLQAGWVWTIAKGVCPELKQRMIMAPDVGAHLQGYAMARIFTYTCTKEQGASFVGRLSYAWPCLSVALSLLMRVIARSLYKMLEETSNMRH